MAEEAEDLVPGDVVRLVSGGLPMTVEAVEPVAGWVRTVWFADTEVRRETLRHQNLVKLPRDNVR